MRTGLKKNPFTFPVFGSPKKSNYREAGTKSLNSFNKGFRLLGRVPAPEVKLLSNVRNTVVLQT
jgi:hypothetical protein